MVVGLLSNKEDFESKVKIGGDKLVMVDFYATWCGPCKMIAPKIEELSQQYTDVCFFKLDVDEVGDVAEQEGISDMPTFFFYKNGAKIDEFVGASLDGIKGLLDKHK